MKFGETGNLFQRIRKHVRELYNTNECGSDIYTQVNNTHMKYLRRFDIQSLDPQKFETSFNIR